MRWLAAVACVVGCASSAENPKPVTKAELGEQLFNDPKLSEPAGQACADCHDPKATFVDPEFERVSPGVLRERVGTRNSPTVLYSQFTPPLHKDASGKLLGGQFWDGRANTLEEQAAFPLVNPLEMNNPSKAAVVAKVKKAYGAQFRQLYGKDAFADTDKAFALVGDAIAAFERTPQMAPFSSKYDKYLAGTAQLTDSEARGLAVFEDPAKGNCASCHPNRPGADGSPPLFTTYTYENLGLPKFADSPFYGLAKDLNPDGEAFIDHGLMTTTNDPAHDGMFRTPTLRNVGKTSPYGHNGYIHRLDEFVEFISGSCRRVGACKWPEPEVATNAQRVRTGGKLTPQEINDLVAFLRTLDDD
ncbi:MAG TPA: cytochrome c peroxidase [Kofleriaceae bacterium]|nr:cytochrome c peroxidase [Kofleriaceae bacterium]